MDKNAIGSKIAANIQNLRVRVQLQPIDAGPLPGLMNLSKPKFGVHIPDPSLEWVDLKGLLLANNMASEYE